MYGIKESWFTAYHFGYHIYSNKRQGRLDKSFGMGANLFQYLLQGLGQTLDDFGHFEANSQS